MATPLQVAPNATQQPTKRVITHVYGPVQLVLQIMGEIEQTQVVAHLLVQRVVRLIRSVSRARLVRPI